MTLIFLRKYSATAFEKLREKTIFPLSMNIKLIKKMLFVATEIFTCNVWVLKHTSLNTILFIQISKFAKAITIKFQITLILSPIFLCASCHSSLHPPGSFLSDLYAVVTLSLFPDLIICSFQIVRCWSREWGGWGGSHMISPESHKGINLGRFLPHCGLFSSLFVQPRKKY